MAQNYFVYAVRIMFFSLFILPVNGTSQNTTYQFDEKLKITSFGHSSNSYSTKTNSLFSTTSSLLSTDEFGDWKTEFSVPGIIGNIYTTASDAQNFYLGGNFKVAGSICANSIVRWDGNKWHSIGEGIENGISSDSTGMPVVLAIAVYKDQIFVGGQFSRAGSKNVNGIACWKGKNWNSLGTGDNNGVRSKLVIEDDTLIQPGSVYSLFVHEDKLYVGGYFQMAGKNETNGVAIWDIKKQKWETMNGGLVSIKDNPSAYGYGFAELNGQIFVGGKFDRAGDLAAGNIAVWDGSNWLNIGNLPDHIMDIKGDGKGHVYALGYYQETDSSGHCGLGMWDGTIWQNIPGPSGYHSTISKITVINDDLFAAGVFEKDDGSNASLAKWNGRNWNIVTGPGFVGNENLHPVIRGIEYVNGRYFIAGDFTRVNDQYVVNVAEWNDQNDTWKALDDGTGNKGIYDGSVFIVEKSGYNIYAGGSFSVAGGKLTQNIARWNGSEWESLGRGDENGINGTVFTILTRDQNVFAGGYFSRAGTSEAFHIAQWDGNKWLPLGMGVGGIHGAHVRDLALVGDYLYVAGYFSKVGDEFNYEIPANSIARFNLTTRKWDAPYKGLEYDEGLPGMVYDIEVFGKQIVIGGEFKMAGGQKAHNYTILEGVEFKNPGSYANVDGLVNAVEIVNNQILIGGHLLYGNQSRVYGILKWTDNNWQQISDEKLGIEDGELFITDIEPFRDGFIAGGYFDKAGNKSLNNIAYFNGSEWLDIGGGIRTGVSDFVITDNRLFVTGPDVISSSTSNGIGLAEFDFNEITAIDDPGFQNTLLSNFPNPFRNSTDINYQVKYPALVNLTVYDISGKRIKTLVNENRTAGQYSTTFYSQDIDPGVYMCRISYGTETETLKIIIM